MSAFTLRIEPELLTEIKRRAGVVPLSRIIRLLLKKWLAGEIEIDYAEED